MKGNFQVRFLEGWPPAMGAGHSAAKMATVRSGEVDFPLEKPRL